MLHEDYDKLLMQAQSLPRTITCAGCVELTAHLAAVEAERDAMEGMYRHHVVVALDAIEKLNRAERTLAALREPSDMIVDALREHIYDLSCFDEAFKAIRIAVAAAESEP